MSETMLALVRAVDSLDPQTCRLFGWLKGTARHKIYDHFRRKAQRQAAYIDGVANGSRLQDDRTPEVGLEQRELRTLIAEIMDTLTDHERCALEWKYLDRLSVAEIGERLDISTKGAEALLFRARGHFRDRYAARLASDERPRLGPRCSTVPRRSGDGRGGGTDAVCAENSTENPLSGCYDNGEPSSNDADDVRSQERPLEDRQRGS